jgi:hypothetical protein
MNEERTAKCLGQVEDIRFYGEKDNQYYLFVSKTGVLMDIGHHFESFTVV